MGININDSTQDFTGQILRGEKTIETRSTRSLDPYIGKRVGIIRTGVGKATLVGYATVGEPVFYDSVAKFRRDQSKHLVAPGSAFDIKDRLRYGYPLMQVEAVEPRQVESRGIVARKVNPMTSDSEYLDAVRRGDMKTAQRMVDVAAKAAGFTSGPWYHGTLGRFNRFNENQISHTGFHFGDERTAKKFSGDEGDLISVYLNIQNPLRLPDLGEWSGDDFLATFRRIFKNTSEPITKDEAETLRDVDSPSNGDIFDIIYKRGYDGIVYSNSAEGDGGDSMMALDSFQIKSADPVTYDDADKVIPLSQRFSDQSDDIRNPYTRPDLRERLKRKIMAGSKGGNPGQWSARKAQLLAAEYEKAGGGYTGKRSASQRSLSKWTKEDWRTKSGKPSLETGERYLPAAAITALTSEEYAETSRAKRKATGQFSRQPKRIAMKTSEFRNPKDPRSAMTQITGTEDTYINASKMLGGKVLDYGAGRGIGTDALRSNGLLADSFEPFPENWEGKRPPTYTDSANIPSDSYDSLVSFSVINVVDPDERKFLFQEVARILRPDGVALITGRDRQDVQKATTKIPHLEEGGYLIGKGKLQRYQKGFTQAELERYAKEVLGPGFTVEANRALNGASIKITKGKPNPAKRNAVRSKLSRIIEPGDRILCYDTASGEDFYRLWDVIHTAMPMTKEALVEVEGMLDDDGVLVIESGETPVGLQDHFRRATRYNGLLLVQGPKNPEQARIETEKLRRELE
jgi:SAM-dependent methyltransferase